MTSQETNSPALKNLYENYMEEGLQIPGRVGAISPERVQREYLCTLLGLTQTPQKCI